MASGLRFTLALPVVWLATSVRAAEPPVRVDSAKIEFFEKKVRPLLVQNCYNCHSANTNTKGGLRVDDRNGLLSGGGRGPAVVAGQPDKSLLLKAVKHDGKLSMPPMKQLTDDQIAVLTQWIKDGAAWPQVSIPLMIGRTDPKMEKLRKEHWAWQSLTDPKVPAVRDTSWARDDIDRFILAKLEAKNLKPVADADARTLIRRVTFDLTGLPPTPAEIDAFVAEYRTAPQAAFEKVVDRLLASPAFGERWGRHWLDVARYGESTGSARNLPYPQAWRYRDYVIDSFTHDKPYDRFLREQIAGDLLLSSTPKQRDEQLIATGFLALGVKDVNQRFKVRFVMDNIDEQIDTVSRAVLAVTASCARCHDHKFDPVPTTDYYALAGIFHSTDLCAGLRNKMGGGGLDYYDTSMLLHMTTPIAAAAPDAKQLAKIAAVKAEFEKAKKEWDAIRGTKEGLTKGPDGMPRQRPYRLKFEKLQAELASLTGGGESTSAILGVREGKAIGDTEVRIRGEAEKLGPVVPRGFLSVVNVPDAPKIDPKHSGRLELAEWLTSTKNPLTPRVMANRVWQHLFGQGIVLSVDNFGVTGDRPSNPELLDHLATRFVRDGWSVKKLVRAVVLSRAYQLGSDMTQAHVYADPANRLVWRHSPRRLEAEEIRDAMLAAAGKLDLSRPGASPAFELKVIEMRNNGPEAKKIEDAVSTSTHRSVYLPLVRTVVPRSLEVFDFAEQGMVTGSRDATTVATQALYLLNDPFVRGQAAILAERLLKQGDDAVRLTTAYALTLGRQPTERETARAKAFLRDYEKAAREDKAKDPKAAAWTSYCQALLASAEFRFVR